MLKYLLATILSCFFLASLLDQLEAFSHFGHRLSVVRRLSTAIDSEAETTTEERVIVVTPKAMAHLASINKEGLCLRMGVRAGGCSGMSYVMDFVASDTIKEDDHIEIFDGIRCAIDPKSLLFLYGLQLDYSDELIGGKYVNAQSSSAIIIFLRILQVDLNFLTPTQKHPVAVASLLVSDRSATTNFLSFQKF